MTATNRTELKQAIIDLGPWHFDIEIADGLSTSLTRDINYSTTKGLDFSVSMIDPSQGFKQTLKSLYPTGLQNRSLLDCACNCGAYCFWAKESGAGRTFGFDARQHWIDQANFIATHRGFPSMSFDTCRVAELASLALPRFDIVLFNGIFEHLSNPIGDLQLAANLTREVLILNGSVAAFSPEPESGCLVPATQSTQSYMSGIEELCWFPSGPNVLTKILDSFGFIETKINFYMKLPTNGGAKPTNQRGRIELMASRVPGLLDNIQPSIREMQI